jgi:hypothetical protein
MIFPSPCRRRSSQFTITSCSTFRRYKIWFTEGHYVNRKKVSKQCGRVFRTLCPWLRINSCDYSLQILFFRHYLMVLTLRYLGRIISYLWFQICIYVIQTYFFTIILRLLLKYLFHWAKSFWEANRFSARQEIHGISWKPKVHYRVTTARHLSMS